MKIGLALGGGGARGFAHLGVLDVLQSSGISFDVIAGTSMGAIIGAFYARQQNVKIIIRQIRSLIQRDIIRELEAKFSSTRDSEKDTPFRKPLLFIKELYLWNLRALRKWLVDYTPFQKLFQEVFTEQKIENLPFPFFCVATDLVEGRAVYLDEGLIWQALLASVSLPGVFPPFKIGSRFLVDGGILESVPVEGLRAKGADFVLAVSLEKKRRFTVLNSSLNILLSVDEIRHMKLVEESLAKADFFISPKVEHYSWADFSKFDEIVEAGRKEARQKIGRLKDTLRKKRGRVFLKRLFLGK